MKQKYLDAIRDTGQCKAANFAVFAKYIYGLIE